MGNHDHMILSRNARDIAPYEPAVSYSRERLSGEMRKELGLLNSYAAIDGIYLCHGTPEDPLNGRAYPDTPVDSYINGCRENDVIIMGHTHYPMCKRYNNTMIMNPGSVGQPRDGDSRASFGLLDTESMGVRIFRVEYDIGAARDLLTGLNWPAQFIAALEKKKK